MYQFVYLQSPVAGHDLGREGTDLGREGTDLGREGTDLVREGIDLGQEGIHGHDPPIWHPICWLS